MERQLIDRIETYDSEVRGRCSCGEEVVKVINSSCSGWKHKIRYRYPNDNSPSNIFRCRGCMNVIHDNFITPVSPSEDKTAEEARMILRNEFFGTFYYPTGSVKNEPNEIFEFFHKAMTEYATICRNKAIEEAVEIARPFIIKEDNRVNKIISELNKLKV